MGILSSVRDLILGPLPKVEPKPLRRIPLTRSEAQEVGKRFEFIRAWKCGGRGCPAQLVIRTREDREDGPSNFVPFPRGHKSEGHSQVDSINLTWNGLAEERGWKVRADRIVCPACQRGMDLPTFREVRRNERIEAEKAALLRKK
jgi:hypothetical protein